MGIRVDVQRTKVYKSFDLDTNKYWFSQIKDKTIHNIDTFYYSVFLNEPLCKDNINRLVSFLNEQKEVLKGDRKASYFIDNLELKLYSHSIYNICLRSNEKYDLFVSSHIPNENTPRILVQVRSSSLWLNSFEDIISESFEVLKHLLKQFGILSIEKVQENRIDYCYHTNSIQAPQKLFNDNNLNKYLNTSFGIINKVGVKTDKVFEYDYLSLGMRSSNRLFFRAYNKGREVIEQNYKGFFIDEWFSKGLISNFDKFCFEYAYKKGTFNSLIEARIVWYLNNGNDEEIKMNLRLLLDSCIKGSANYIYAANFIKNIIPEVTVILNFEFQTMRKFYKSFDDSINQFEVSNNYDILLNRVFSIIQNRKCILDYLTKDVVCFDLAFWTRIQNVKINDIVTNADIKREYTFNLDKEKVKQKVLSNLSTLSIYDKFLETSLQEDIINSINLINDNDINNYYQRKERKAKELENLIVF